MEFIKDDVKRIPEYGKREFEDNEEVAKLLNNGTPAQLVTKRQGPSNTILYYIEGQNAFRIANSIFGYDGWSTLVRSFNIEQTGNPTIAVACVRVTLKNGAYHEDMGVGIGTGGNMSARMDTAIKSAITDGTKRALRMFGDILGNSLYQKRYLNLISKDMNNALEFNLIGALDKQILKMYIKEQNEKLEEVRQEDKKKLKSKAVIQDKKKTVVKTNQVNIKETAKKDENEMMIIEGGDKVAAEESCFVPTVSAEESSLRDPVEPVQQEALGISEEDDNDDDANSFNELLKNMGI